MKERNWKMPERRRKPIGAGLGPAGTLREGPAPPQLPDEPDKEYDWLRSYWREGTARSLREIARRLGAPKSTFARVRQRQHWDARIQAWLDEPPEVKRAWAARQEVLREAEWKLYQECLQAGREALRQWQESGRTASPGDVVRLLELGTKLARMAAGAGKLGS